jgi:putative phosphoribosyl transferase
LIKIQELLKIKTHSIVGWSRVKATSSTIGKTAKMKLQVKLKNRYAAGTILGDLLKDDLKSVLSNSKYSRWQHQILVLGIPRGGVITASAVASKLSTNLEFIASTRLVAPHDEEITIGAVVGNGDLYLNEDIVSALDISSEYIASEKSKAMELIESRRSKYQLAGPKALGLNIRDKAIVLIDDGAASGSTIIAALRNLRTFNPRHLVVGVPILPQQTLSLLRKEADVAECIWSIDDKRFRSVEQYYEDFAPVSDPEVMAAKAAITQNMVYASHQTLRHYRMARGFS